MNDAASTATQEFDAGHTPEFETLADLVAAGVRVIVLTTPDEARADDLLEALAQSFGLSLRRPVAAGGPGDTPSAALLARLRATPEDDAELWVVHEALRFADPSTRAALQRRLREQALRRRGPVLVLVEVEGEAPAPEIPRVHLAPPTVEALGLATRAWLKRARTQLAEESVDAREALDESLPRLAREALGLERFELLRALRRAAARSHAPGPEGGPTPMPDAAALHASIREEKSARVAHDGVLERVDAWPLRELGGLERFKSWLHRRALALDPRARAAAIPVPRGVMLVGVQGCGKSLAARACADVLELPLFRLDPGRLFEGIVGGSEARLARTLETVDRMAPLVLWLDEVDKGLAGSEGSSADGGTTARVVGALLTWLQERSRPVFVVATANDPTRLPAELLRRGRLDELFFVDLPDADTRARILEIHLELRPKRALGQAPAYAASLDDFRDLAREAEGFSGAELEAALVEARLEAFARGEALSPADLRRALEVTVPLSRARKEKVESLRRWARDRARPA